jgi:dipeptidyl aminopeptidase/acylaminoacyl peptidase
MSYPRIGRVVWVAVGFISLVTGSSLAEELVRKHPLTVEDMWKVKRLGTPALSPDGKWVAIELTSYRMAENDSQSELWLLATDGKSARQLTTYPGRNSDPVWSPDGKRIAFVGQRGSTGAQIYLISPDGGEASQLTKMPMSPSGLKWAADGKTICCIARTWPDTSDDASYRKKEKSLNDSKVKAFIIDDALYRTWNEWIADGRRPVVFAVDVASGVHKNLFADTRLHLPVLGPPDQLSPAHYDIAPDGKELCFTADSFRETGTDYNRDLYLMPLDKPGEPRNITADNPANDQYPAYSPDGRSIAYTAQAIKFFYADRQRLMLYDRQSGKRHELTAKFDRSCGPPLWSADSRRIYFEAQDKGHVRIYAVTPQDNGVVALTSDATDHAPVLSRDGSTLGFLRSTFGRPPAVHATPTAQGTPRKLDTFNDALAAGWDLGEVKEVYFKGANDDDVQMWIVHPPGFDAKKKWPLLQVVHGGPHGAMLDDFNFRYNLHLFASRGYVVASINFHGSSSFGQAFVDSITGDMGTRPMTDVMKGTDYMEALPYIDKKRTAAFGASYGGFMMAWLNGHTDRFRALVCHAGVYNWHSMMASDYARNMERPLGAMPWGDLSLIDKQSPQRFAKNFKTPTLVTHGERDYRVPVTQGLEYYNTLRIKGVPSRLVYFPDEDHSILKPQNSILWYREVFAWLDKYVGHGGE